MLNFHPTTEGMSALLLAVPLHASACTVVSLHASGIAVMLNLDPTTEGMKRP